MNVHERDRTENKFDLIHEGFKLAVQLPAVSALRVKSQIGFGTSRGALGRNASRLFFKRFKHFLSIPDYGDGGWCGLSVRETECGK